MRDLPAEEVDEEISGKWERMAESSNVDDQDGPPSLYLASKRYIDFFNNDDDSHRCLGPQIYAIMRYCDGEKLVL